MQQRTGTKISFRESYDELTLTRLVKGYNLRGKTGININFRESYESKTHFLISYFHVTVHFPHTIHIQF